MRIDIELRRGQKAEKTLTNANKYYVLALLTKIVTASWNK